MTSLRSSSSENWTSALVAPSRNCNVTIGRSMRRRVSSGLIGRMDMPVQPYGHHEATLQPNWTNGYPPADRLSGALPRSVRHGGSGKCSGARSAMAWRDNSNPRRLIRCARSGLRHKYRIHGRVLPFAEFCKSVSGIDGSSGIMLVPLRRQGSLAQARCSLKLDYTNGMQVRIASDLLGRRCNLPGRPHATKSRRDAATRYIIRNRRTTVALRPSSFVQTQLWKCLTV